ncbi:MAG: glycosyltransferase [Gammaproteobacteria bacterium]|nr:glycosyltransferase [Gammaproteobacteria bacterium]
MNICLVIPTYNAEKFIEPLFNKIAQQTLQPTSILVIDSSSRDNTTKLLAKYNCIAHVIPQHEFDHAGTRKLATQLQDADFYIFMTQDALPANEHTFENLMLAYNNSKVGCAYGRQLPFHNATPLARHARLFNYPAQSQLRSLSDAKATGIKTCFNSDSFSSYRKQALLESGNFPERLIVGEDAVVAGKLLLNDWLIAYQAKAEVYHSHNYSLKQELERYFDIGVFHRLENWLLTAFNRPEREGLRFTKSEILYLYRNGYYTTIPRCIAGVFIRYLGYRLGYHYRCLPNFLRKVFSMHKYFWRN